MRGTAGPADKKESRLGRLTRNKWVRLAFVLALFAGYCLLMSAVVGTPCPVSLITGFPCPACGMTRANLLALRLDLAGAFAMHPLFFYSYIAAAAVILFTYKPEWARKKVVTVTAAVLAAVFVAVYVYRMIAFYPSGALTYNCRSLLGLLRKYFHF